MNFASRKFLTDAIYETRTVSKISPCTQYSDIIYRPFKEQRIIIIGLGENL